VRLKIDSMPAPQWGEMRDGRAQPNHCDRVFMGAMSRAVGTLAHISAWREVHLVPMSMPMIDADSDSDSDVDADAGADADADADAEDRRLKRRRRTRRRQLR
jgi:hypothetical protein